MMKCAKILVFLLSSLTLEQASASYTSNVFKTAFNISKNVVKEIGKTILPTPWEVFNMGKQAIAGYPFEFVSSAINKVCSTAVASKSIQPSITPDINQMNFQLRTTCGRLNFPLLEANKMWRSPEFDATKKVVILATGWGTTINESDAIDVLAKAYNCRGDVNFVAVDVASFVNTLYSWSALNTYPIGEAIATGLVQLSELMPIANIHLIGHSLGAHIVGTAARKFRQQTGYLIEHVTGLDPAKPCFNEGENLSGLQRDDAAFIDVIHSNPGVLGKTGTLGDIDFYPGGVNPLPPGCFSVICAHVRAWEYYAETVYPGNERNFMATRCSSLSKLNEGICSDSLLPMGYTVPHNVTGHYFLNVNVAKPYGEGGSKDREASFEDCGLCKNNGSLAN